MSDSTKYFHGGGGGGGRGRGLVFLVFELRKILRNRRTVTLAYSLMFTFVALTVFILLNPSSNPSSYTFITNILGTDKEDRSRVSSYSVFDNFLFPNHTSTVHNSRKRHAGSGKMQELTNVSPPPPPPPLLNSTHDQSSAPEKKKKGDAYQKKAATAAAADDPLDSLRNCDFFDGDWVRDDSYPLYQPGSCSSIIDEQFNCLLNGRPDKDYQNWKWKPKACDLPRLNGSQMLELLRGKRLAFVGDSLNRNMWESLVCILRGSVKDQNKVYKANGRKSFPGEASFSYIFKDYGLAIDFFVSPFLVREWEVRNETGSIKETLRLDLIGMLCDQYKDADILVFNTGHWWTHDKTSKGEDYYQEGSHVYKELNVLEAFRKAITTWGRWIDANVDPSKTLVFFRGYSESHFSGGQWNSGGQCNSETEPIKNITYLREYPPKMAVLERVLKGMKTPVGYLNVTRMTDYRKDAHPSVYRKQHLTDEERRSPLRFQDCSHWCLPGVPDTWNEILYAKLLVAYVDEGHKTRLQQQKRS